MAKDELPPQKAPPAFGLRVVDPDADPALPVEERIDLEKTKWAHEVVTDGGKKTPLIAQALQSQVVIPTELEAKAVEHLLNAGTGICGGCAHCDYAAGQEMLKKGVAWNLFEVLGKKVGMLHPWRNYGYCSEHNLLVAVCDPALRETGPCPEYRERALHKFGRMIGGAWKRLRDI